MGHCILRGGEKAGRIRARWARIVARGEVKRLLVLTAGLRVLLPPGEVEQPGYAKLPIVAQEKGVPSPLAVGLNEDTAGIPPAVAIVEIVAMIIIVGLNITEIVRLTMRLDHEVVRLARAVRTLTAVPTARAIWTCIAVPMQRVVPMPSVDRMNEVDFAGHARIVAGVDREGFEDGAQVGPKARVMAVASGAVIEVLLVDRVRRGIAPKRMRSR